MCLCFQKISNNGFFSNQNNTITLFFIKSKKLQYYFSSHCLHPSVSETALPALNYNIGIYYLTSFIIIIILY